jgi:hypothetical protein
MRWFGVAFAMVACGGSVATSPDGGTSDDGASPSGDAAGWTSCTSPGGARICSGPAQCPDSKQGDTCSCDGPFSNPQVLRLCLTDHPGPNDGYSNPPDLNCGRCPDGMICIAAWQGGAVDFCAAYDFGVLYANAGQSGPDMVRYADGSKFTSTPLPQHQSCPSVSGLQLCGPGCDPCPTSAPICTGRSPTHPYSWCAPDPHSLGGADPYGGGDTRNGYKGPACAQGASCFVYKTEPELQSIAKDAAICLPTAECQAAAANLPGGGTCYAPPSCDTTGCGCFQPN